VVKQRESLRDCWGTPPEVVDALARRHAGGAFDLDVCASPWNAKCAEYFDRGQNGLTMPWHGFAFCNPPFSRIPKWVTRAIRAIHGGRDADQRAEGALLLLPARTDMDWFVELSRAAVIEPVIGRIPFIPPPGVSAGTNSGPERYVVAVLRRPFRVREHVSGRQEGRHVSALSPR
jgi:phage N-6-adenine-methyltransferase